MRLIVSAASIPKHLFEKDVDVKSRTERSLEQGNILMDDLGLEHVIVLCTLLCHMVQVKRLQNLGMESK